MSTNPPEYPWLADLNPAQLAAVTHGDGPLLVVAGAGSGKTRTLAYRVAYLVSQGVEPHRILLLTFTRRAAQEMIRRAGEILSQASDGAMKVWGGTFHAVAHRLLRIYATAAGLSPDFTVIDQGDAEDVMGIVRHQLGYDEAHQTGERFPRKGTCLSIYSRCMAGAEDLDLVLKRYFPWCARWEAELKDLFRAYTERKQQQMVLDYDDLLIYLDMILQDPEVATEIDDRFDHVLVDEYQDTNPIQASILLGLRRLNRNLMVVGDDAQSIYSFRAATVRNMLDFPKQFAGAAVVKLEQNYRSIPEILETTNRLIGHAKERFTKDLWSDRAPGARPRLVMCEDEPGQDSYVIERVLGHLESGIPLNRQAVLFRASHHADSLEVELARRKIPYRKYGGLRFTESAHIKDLVCFLRVLDNPRDEIAWFRLLRLLDGVGPKTAAAAWEHIQEQAFRLDALSSFAAPRSAAAGIERLATMLGALGAGGSGHPTSQVEQIRSYYQPIMTRRYENGPARTRDLEHLEQIATRYDTRQQFLADLVLDPPTSTADIAGVPGLEEDWLNLSTIHSAKGMEWDVVAVIHASDGFLPSDMATGDAAQIEEEMRLTYVALTRAKDYLYVTYPMRYYHTGRRFTQKHTYVQLCRFLEPNDVKSTFDLETPGPRHGKEAASGKRSRTDIAAKLRSRWE